jgi:hypothetical protein
LFLRFLHELLIPAVHVTSRTLQVKAFQNGALDSPWERTQEPSEL